MIRALNAAAWAAGLAAVVWVAFTHAASHPAVLPLLGLIVATFVAGGMELRRYRSETQDLMARLQAARAAPPAEVEPWITGLPAALQSTVRLRLQGDRAALPGPLMTPYLTGLLVLLGLLGTFLGMVAALGGTVQALGTAADLQAVRSALASPVQGLGLAFGTSVAGVAASAALGLMSAMARAERTQASRELDAALATALHVHTEDHRRQVMLKLLQDSAAQAERLPMVAQQLEAAMASMAEQQRLSATALGQSQAQFLERTAQDAQELGQALGRGLRESVAEGARRSAQQMEPVLQALQTQSADTMQALKAQLAEGLHALQVELSQGAHQTQERLVLAQEQSQTQLLDSLSQARRDWAHEAHALQAKWAEQTIQTQQALSAAAERSAQDLVHHGSQGFDDFLKHLQQLTADWLKESAREQAQVQQELTVASAQAVQALREQTIQSVARDQEQLAERERLLGAVDTLMRALQHAATEQAQALDGLLASAAQKLDDSAGRFDAQAAQVAQTLSLATEQAGASAQTLAQVGESFAQSLQGFGRVNTELGEQLARVEAALNQNLARSDEQLAYYVAQAREVVELTLGAQQQLLEDLRRVSRASPTAMEAAA